MRDAPPPESIEILAAEVRDQLAVHRSHVESLDARAGVVLAFSGLLAALGPGSGSVWTDLARLGGVVSGVVALFAILPRNYPSVDLRAFRRGCMTVEPAPALLALVDTKLNVLDHAALVIDHKSRCLKGSIAALLIAIIFGLVGIVGYP